MTFTEPGEYKWTVTEDHAGETIKGVNYQAAPVTVTIKVKDNGEGELIADTGSALVQTAEFTNTYSATGSILLGGTKTLEGRNFSILDTLSVYAYEGTELKAQALNVPLDTTGNTAEFTLSPISYDLSDVGGAGKQETFTYTVLEIVSMKDTDVTVGEYEVVVTVKDNYNGILSIESVTVGGKPVQKDQLTKIFGGIDFINTYRTHAEAPLTAVKELKGQELKPGDFTFTLKGSDDVISLIGKRADQTKLNGDNGIVTFDSLRFAVNPTADQLEEGYVDIATLPMTKTGTKSHYDFELTLAEDETGLDDREIRIDGNKQYKITVNVDYDEANGELKVSIKPDDTEFKFTNLKNATTEINVEARKDMFGRDLEGKDFWFILSGEMIETQEKANDKDGNVDFDTIRFAVYPTKQQLDEGYIDVTGLLAEDDEITIELTVSEDLDKLDPEIIPVSPMNEDGTMSQTITITLKYDRVNGTLSASRSKERAAMTFINRTVKVKKTDFTSGEELPGAVIRIYEEDPSVQPDHIGAFVTEVEIVKGGAEIPKLQAGKGYILREVKAPYGYHLAGDIRFEIRTTDGAILTDDDAQYLADDNTIVVKDKMKKVPAIVKKVWIDDDNRDVLRLKSLTVSLYADGVPTGQSVTLTGETNWIGMISDLPMVTLDKDTNTLRDIVYTWEEDRELLRSFGYELTNTHREGSAAEGYLTTLTNTHVPEETSVSVKKIWLDNNNKAQKRTPSVKVQLFADGIAVDEPVVLDAEHNWEHTWTKLCKYSNDNGSRHTIVYTVEETEIPEGYIAKVTGNASTGFVVKNTYETGKLIIEKNFDIAPWEPFTPDDSPVDIPVIKTWNDNGNRDGNRPESVTVHLFADGEEIASAQLNEANGWKTTFTGLQRLREDKEKIVYTITEDPVEWYTAEINGYNIRNNYKPELTSVTVRKEWNDNNNAAGGRPKSIVMTLSNGMTVTLSDENGWTATIENLPTRVDGKPVTYTWTEQKILNYTKTGEVTEGNVTIFTNTYWTRPPENPGKKTPKTPGSSVITFEEYQTPLGMEVIINHVGDCFD